MGLANHVLAVAIFAAGFVASLFIAAIVLVILRDQIGTQPDVLGFEDIRELSNTQERMVGVVFFVVWALGSWLSFRLARNVWQAPAGAPK
jgi:hypothetical protein